MTIPFVIGYDAIHANINHLPKGQAAGYTTGSPDIKWTAADWAAHPGAIRYDQDASASDFTADVLDVERGAATPAECPGWARMSLVNYEKVTRPGQRQPAIYCSASMVTPVVNALKAGGVTSGVHLIVANWSDTQAQAIQIVETAAGPFPIAGVQYTDSPGFYDIAVYDAAWVNTVSHVPAPKPAGPYVHFTDGKHTLAQMAAGRNESVWSLLENALRLAAPAERAALAKALGAVTFPAGIRWDTVNP